MDLSLHQRFFATEYLVAAGLLLATSLVYRYSKSPTIHLPPGPKPLPFIGNVLQLPTEKQPEVFQEWADQYGDVVHFQIFGQSAVILDSLQAARDLLDKRSSIYSDRPRFVLFSELMGWHNASTHMRYGRRFRKHRRFISQVFNSNAVPAFRPLQEKEAWNLMEGLLHSPDSFLNHFRRYAAATILKITYGHDVQSVDDHFVLLAERAASMTVESGSPAATLVDFFPAMRHIPTWAPFSNFKRKALETRKAVEAMMEIPYELVKANMVSGIAVPSYTSTLLESRRNQEDGKVDFEDEEDIKGSAGTLYAAAEDTTVAIMHTFILAMVLHPRVFKKVQEEVDQVVGNQRLPTSEDRPSLPYLECVIKEVLRWNPVVPLGMPHRVMETDHYRDFVIPAGATILVNIYGILRHCSNPDVFRPERYMDEPDLPDPTSVVFGFGRRICPGRFLADAGLWLTLTSMIAFFDISTAYDQGKEIIPTIAFADGLVRHPKPFQCSIKPRSGNIEHIITQARANAR